ncbi:hypothetical protein VP01_3350g4 [Puccinia sorghi]|uniref:Uncharacterized protein n=1 Tax=Puccinia sorghi TaxID=27349 RepID=A0A0L6UX45_9BASI|nr:hypothetical protein VP01_3350g4 [Puccinia sorghi]
MPKRDEGKTQVARDGLSFEMLKFKNDDKGLKLEEKELNHSVALEEKKSNYRIKLEEKK